MLILRPTYELCVHNLFTVPGTYCCSTAVVLLLYLVRDRRHRISVQYTEYIHARGLGSAEGKLVPGTRYRAIARDLKLLVSSGH